MTLQINSALLLDGYKTGHRGMYPKGTSFVHSNLTARSSRHSSIPEDIHENKVVLFGGNYFIENYVINHWNENFFSKPEDEVVSKYTGQMNAYLGPNTIGEDHIRALHKHGCMPIRIKSLPEGTRVPIQVPMMIIENIGDEFFWVTNYLETLWSTTTWLPITSATTAYAYRTILEKYADITGGSKEFVMFQGHDFSFRGMAGLEAALMSGAAHLTSFYGTDTVPAISFLKEFYRAGEDANEIIGVSVPASEHAVASSNICYIEEQLRETGLWNGWGLDILTPEGEEGNFRMAAEVAMMKYFITVLYPTGIVSLVSDTYDYWAVITKIVPLLKDDILERDGKTVIRPDSGNPVKIVCGYTYQEFKNQQDFKDFISENYETNDPSFNKSGSYFEYENSYDLVKIGDVFYEYDVEYNGWEMASILDIEMSKTEMKNHEIHGSIKVLWDIFGGTTTEKGYKTLDSHIGLIYGDGINFNSCEAMMDGLEKKGFASDNIVLGYGSYGYQMVTRDTFGMAVKATFCIVNGEPQNIYKDPKTGSGKKSAKGLLAVLKDGDGELYLRQEIPYDEYMAGVKGDQMRVVFEDGVHLIKPTLKEIRERLWG